MGDNEKYTKRYKHLDDDYSQWKSFYKDVTKFIWPTGGGYLEDGNPGDKSEVHGDVLVDSAEYANKILGAGMMGGLCSPSRPWHRLGLMDEDLEKFGAVKDWLSLNEDVMRKVFLRSNFYEAAHMGFEEQGAFGTECMFYETHWDQIVRFYPFTAGQYRIATGGDGRVDTIYRKVPMTVVQMSGMFGEDKLNNAAQKMLKENPYKYFNVIHVLQPRPDRDFTKDDPQNMKWESVWFQPEEADKKLRVSGYPHFPASVSRWATRGNCPYGFGPGHAAMGGTKMVQEMEKTGVKGLHQMVNPSMAVPAKFKGVLDLTPGSQNYDTSSEKALIRRLFEINLPLGDLESKIYQIEKRVERAFYNDMFMLISNLDRTDVTATEVLERKEEKLLMLGPTIERQIKEKLEPVVEFVFKEVNRRGLVPPPPPELQGQEIKIEFISLLAQAQKLVTAQGMRTYMAEVERVAQLYPDSTIKTDVYEYLGQYGEIIGVPSKIIKTEDDTNKMLAEINEQRAEAAQQDRAMQESEMAKNLGSASTAGDTALGTLKQDMGF